LPPKISGQALINKTVYWCEKIKDVFVAIYSTSNSEKDMEDTFNNGANVYITKPSDFNALKQVLERVVMTISLYKDTVMKRENFLLRL
jgi:DNA-binding NarL/FixJ family response regulator